MEVSDSFHERSHKQFWASRTKAYSAAPTKASAKASIGVPFTKASTEVTSTNGSTKVTSTEGSVEVTSPTFSRQLAWKIAVTLPPRNSS